MRARAAVASLGLAAIASACHVTALNEVTRPARVEQITHREQGVPGAPTLVVDARARLRFVEPLSCPTETRTTLLRGRERTTRPNLATFVVGIIATSAGAIALVNGIASGDATGSAYTYGGGALLAVGLPLAVGPWVGHRTSIAELPSPAPVARPGAPVACGDRPLAASSATLRLRGLEVHGSIAADGSFAVSPFAIVDAFARQPAPALAIAATIASPSGPRTVDTIIDGARLVAAAPHFLANAVDATIEPMRLVPGLEPGMLRLHLSSDPSGPGVRLVLPLRNAGPGPAFAVRAQLIASGHPAIDGRILYVGRIAAGAELTGELWIPLAPQTAEALRNATLDVAVELRDAHGTAPTTPIRFRGPLLADAPR